MSPSNPLFALIIYLIAFVTAFLINQKYKLVSPAGRFENIDGLRGFLALGVFIHHANIWFVYAKTAHWKEPTSNLYNQFGQTSVAFFFMITSFLFVSKLLNSKKSGFNWNRFFVSRIFRLAPMYYVSLILIVLYVMIISNWEIISSTKDFVLSIFHWSAFTITTTKHINDLPLTVKINANVNWSLPFEWLFYFSLPIISLLILKRKPAKIYLAISLLFVAGFFIAHGFETQHLLSFVGGAVAPFLIRYDVVKRNVDSYFFSVLIVLCALGILFFHGAGNSICKLLISIIFTLIALGNSMFGVLRNQTLKFLGEICYSTYLLHGIILFTTFYFILGFRESSELSETRYCFIVFLITPIVVLLSFFGFKFIEKPFMDFSRKIKI